VKTIAIALLVCGLPLPAFALAPEQVQFTGSVQYDDGVPVDFDLRLPARQAMTLQLADGAALELVTPGNAASPHGTLVRLVSRDGRVLHTATVPDPGLASQSFAYRICNGQVTYVSPAPASPAGCGT